jgi:predicted nucleotidyltransferase
MLHLSSEQIQITRSILHTHLPEVQVCVFGSRNGGQPRKTSDLDLLVMDAPALTHEQRAELKLAFSASDLPFFVDIVEKSRISAAFFNKISPQAQPISFLASNAR